MSFTFFFSWLNGHAKAAWLFQRLQGLSLLLILGGDDPDGVKTGLVYLPIYINA